MHRLPLNPDQAAWLRERGRHFVCVTVGSYPSNPGGFDLVVVECGESIATSAANVAMGRATVKKSSPASGATREKSITQRSA
ncbi:hypothetical protein [Luteolibacter rhizosphaerae]|uniref:hypothetical protein n=1 Tax=Luteolibacter rhizosphaerae TaxID=2989719 RepID=UPI002221E9CF|nr:hypothetical protein [Luteolibacter rhizosphaerae]